jgi:diguanylate cyclase (GGDEF)-like protein
MDDPKPARSGVKAHRILVAEDDPNLRDALGLQLSAAGFDVELASDGEQALWLAFERPPDLVLLDVMMPKMDGYQVCAELRRSFQTRHIPIIMLTAKSTLDDKVQGLEEGANDYITKPWHQRELVQRVRNALEWSQTQRSASPLTGLPGNLSIGQEIQKRVDSGQPFAMLQIDIDYFKAYNDHYNYARGDEAIKHLSTIILQVVKGHGGADDFVGHIGGDDFVVLTRAETGEAIGEEIIRRFDDSAVDLYDAADRKNGYVEVPNRRHVIERFPLMSLTVVLVSTDRFPLSHVAELEDVARELKAHGKGLPGSVLVRERRNDRAPTPLKS